MSDLISDGEEEDDATPPMFPSKRVRKNPTPTDKDPPPPGYASTPFLVEDDEIPLSHGASLGAVASSNREDKLSGKRVISLESDSEDSPRPLETSKKSCIAMTPKVKRRRTDARSETHIQDLPDCLLSHTLGFLPTEIAATTSVLSKRWRKLFAFAPNLSFKFQDMDEYRFQDSDSDDDDDCDDDDDDDCDDDADENKAASIFVNFVERVLVLREKEAIKKLSLEIDQHVHKDKANNLILSALDCHVSDLELSLYNLRGPWFGPHPNIYLAESLVKLEIGIDCRIIAPEVGFKLPSLKDLCLDDVSFEDGCSGFLKLLSGCPVLKELTLKDMKWSGWDVCCVSSTSLTVLQICWEVYDDDEYHNGCPKSVIFHTPNLVHLDYADDDVSELPSFNFENLVGAKLALGRKGEHEENFIDFWLGMKSIEILFLLPDTFEVLSSCGEDEIPVFNKLEQLTITTKSRLEWESLSSLLNKCPNLKTIYLKKAEEEEAIDCEGEDRLAFMEKVLAFLEEMNLED